ncbi:MAG TPA: Na+/H+ antiporter subunit G [Opitutae bacterium]|nr:Na+/H+ antiporter subunit G [Opitutae bacterium]
MSIVVAVLMILGSFFAFVAALGVNRMPDFYMRMHAATKAGAFGAALMLSAAALHFGSLRAVITALAIIVFFYLTTPVAAQTIAEAAYRKGEKLWPKSGRDQLAEDEATQSTKLR